jgi:heme/copper-type cytochrome/quinol oxidase subunit 3
LSFHKLSVIIAGACGLFATFIATYVIHNHGMHYTKPNEQKQIIRAALILPGYALVCFFVVWQNGDAAQYISPALDVAEAFPIAAFFLLLSAYIENDKTQYGPDQVGTGQGQTLAAYKVYSIKS